MVQSSGLKGVFSRFTRGSSVKKAASNRESPSKLENAASVNFSPAKRLFSFSPTKATNSSRKKAPVEQKVNDLIPAVSLTSPFGSQQLSQPDDSSIKVIVRIRPRNEREASIGGAVCVQTTGPSSLKLTQSAEPHMFAFDHVADESSTQEDIFMVAGRPIVENCLKGFNGCLIAYGQTGSGKTFSMLGSEQSVGDAEVRGWNDSRRGLIQRIFEHIFDEASASAHESYSSIKVKCSFLEIYNETISDLLCSSSGSQNPSGLPLREDKRLGCGVYVEGLCEQTVTNVDEVTRLLQVGIANRRVGETMMNERSSRSHSVFTATVERCIPGQHGSPDTVLRSRLHLVDLAGSERQKTTGAAGERLREASGINKSLSTLGLVIMSLVDQQQQGRARHIPYRDSKLTTLLKDSLGGNAKTVMVACVSPAAVNAAETLSTLRFADGAKRIKNTAVVNEDIQGDVNSLRKELRRLKEELALARTQCSSADDPPTTPRNLHGHQHPHIACAPPTTGGGPAGDGGVRRALLGALRREEAAAIQISALQHELESMRELVAARDADLQRTQMMLKLKESRLSRTPLPSDDLISSLNSEIDLLKSKLEAHPEVKRFAVECLHSSNEVARLQSALDTRELDALKIDIASLRREILGLAETAEVAEEDAARARAEAQAAQTAFENQSQVLKEIQTKYKDGEAAPVLKKRIAELVSKNDELQLVVADAKAVREEADRICAHAAGLEAQCESLKSSLDAKNKECQHMEAAYKGTTEQLSVAWDELAATEALLKSTERDRKSLAEELETLRHEREASLANACQVLEDSMRQVANLKQEVQLHQNKVDDVSTTLATVTEERDHLVQELQVTKTKVSTYKQELEMNNESLNRTKKELESTREKLSALQKSSAKLEIKLVEAQSGLAKATSSNTKLKLELESAINTHKQEYEELQEELRCVEAIKDELEYDLSDKSASLAETTDQLKTAHALLAQSTENEINLSAQVTELESQLRVARHAVESSNQECMVLERKVELLGEELKQSQGQIAALRGGPLEKERELLMARAELADTKSKLEKARTEACNLLAGMKKKDEEVARIRAEMAAEVSDAAHQVQELLAAQARAEAAEERAAELAKLCLKSSLGHPPDGTRDR